ncbi:DUF3040 domain-containing protein [Actinomadura algeriensis]|uniref:DUF3040 domain-containing protein n=1 Tax=Actinomadura algeriensis TaxID=1679523 RepID=A0ABR9JQF6_9ACTN|nr:DUF3040 domain-containing protein [Actinomadura algeriensis]MBE1532804.1 hypothetical protein [Actinomadura algeriensis]
MGLSQREELLLRRIDARLRRDDPLLAHRLATFTPDRPAPDPTPDERGRAGFAVSWRPPRSAIVVMSMALAAAVVLLALVMLSVRPPCERPATVRSPASAAGPPSVPSAAPPPATC